MTGGYYWFPSSTKDGITWSVVTCRDLGCESDDGHDADLWPRLIHRLAETWSKDPKALSRRLALSYTGLPRGRVTRPEKTYLILHGGDSPDFPSGWDKAVIKAFGLSGRSVKSLFDEHETQIAEHSQAVEASLGERLFSTGR